MSNIIHRSLRSVPRQASRAQGAYVYDTEGKAYLDGSGGAAVTSIGYSHSKVLAAMQKQMNEIAYVQYNKMHINAIEAMDRLSVGAAADGGYFDFISTEYGMGVKWRAVNQSNGASLNMMRARMKVMVKKAAEYEAVRDEDGVFKTWCSEGFALEEL